MLPPVYRRLLSLAWPIIGLNLLNVLALAVDTAMVGRLMHAEASLTGLGYGTQIIFLLMVAMMGLTAGTVAFVARAHGARDDDRVNHILAQSTQLTVIVGLAAAVAGNLVAPALVRALGGEGEAFDAAIAYLRPMLAGSALVYLNLLYAAVLRGVGNTRLPFGIAVASNLLNAVLNYGFILGNWGLPALGVQGAAIGTVLSQGFAVAVMVWLLRQGAVPGVKAPLRTGAFDWPLVRDLGRVGTPAALDMLVLNAAFLSIIGMLGRIDQAAVAAHGVGLRTQAMAFVPGMSVSQATGPLVGAALGAGDVEEAKRVLRASVVLCVAIMTALGIPMFVAAPAVVALYDVAPGTPIGDYAVMWMHLLGTCMPIAGIYVAFVGLLQGAGATRTSLLINLAATALFQIPLSYALGFPLGMAAFGVWLAFPLSFFAKAGLAWWAYRGGSWAKTGTRA